MAKLDQHVPDAHRRAGRRRSPWNLLLVPLCIAGIALVWAGLVVGLVRLQRSFIPADCILYSHTRIGGILMFVPPLLPALAIGMELANLAAWCVVPARRIFQKEAKGTKGASFGEATKHLLIASALLLILTAPVSLWGALNYFYVTEEGVALNGLWAFKETRYCWSDIVAVETRCIAERDNLHLNYIVRMKDGQWVDLLEEPRLEFAKAYDRIVPHIEQQSHIRYSSDITDSGLRRLKARYSPENVTRLMRVLAPIDNPVGL